MAENWRDRFEPLWSVDHPEPPVQWTDIELKFINSKLLELHNRMLQERVSNRNETTEKQDWRMVPVEPTKEAIQSMMDYFLETQDWTFSEMYKVGIAAAPTPMKSERSAEGTCYYPFNGEPCDRNAVIEDCATCKHASKRESEAPCVNCIDQVTLYRNHSPLKSQPAAPDKRDPLAHAGDWIVPKIKDKRDEALRLANKALEGSRYYAEQSGLRTLFSECRKALAAIDAALKEGG